MDVGEGERNVPDGLGHVFVEVHVGERETFGEESIQLWQEEVLVRQKGRR